MAQRHHHYERAFEEYVRARRIPYVAVDEARKALLPGSTPDRTRSLKSFDFVIYGGQSNLLVDIKGRKVAGRRGGGRGVMGWTGGTGGMGGADPLAAGRLESWVTLDDVESLRSWEGLFGPAFRGAFVFIYWCEQQPPDALFQEVLEHKGRWYALRAVLLEDYTAAMQPRSRKWRTVHVPTREFERISHPFAPPEVGPGRTAVPHGSELLQRGAPPHPGGAPHPPALQAPAPSLGSPI